MCDNVLIKSGQLMRPKECRLRVY